MDTRARDRGTLSHINYTGVAAVLMPPFHTFLHLRLAISSETRRPPSTFSSSVPRDASSRPFFPTLAQSFPASPSFCAPLLPSPLPPLFSLHFVFPASLSLCSFRRTFPLALSFSNPSFQPLSPAKAEFHRSFLRPLFPPFPRMLLPIFPRHPFFVTLGFASPYASHSTAGLFFLLSTFPEPSFFPSSRARAPSERGPSGFHGFKLYASLSDSPSIRRRCSSS